jgi:hypothetical protein
MLALFIKCILSIVAKFKRPWSYMIKIMKRLMTGACLRKRINRKKGFFEDLIAREEAVRKYCKNRGLIP